MLVVSRILFNLRALPGSRRSREDRVTIACWWKLRRWRDNAQARVPIATSTPKRDANVARLRLSRRVSLPSLPYCALIVWDRPPATDEGPRTGATECEGVPEVRLSEVTQTTSEFGRHRARIKIVDKSDCVGWAIAVKFLTGFRTMPVIACAGAANHCSLGTTFGCLG